MDRNQGVDVLSEACFPLLESTKFNGPVDKCQPTKLSDKILQKGSSGNNFNDSSFLNEKNLDLSNSVTSLNSSPPFNSNSYQPFEERKQIPGKISEHLASQELGRSSGVGRGKHRMKFSSVHEVEKERACSYDADSDKVLNSADLLEVKSGSTSSTELHKSVKALSDTIAESMEKSDRPIANESCEQPSHLGESQMKDNEVKNVPNSTMERFGNPDYRRLQNGIESVYKGYNKGKPFRLARFHNNNSSPVQYKYDGRSMAPKHFPFTQTLNALRTVKNNDSYYRHNENRRNQPSKTGFSSDVDKMVYAKQRAQMCNEKDITTFDSNRNMSHGCNKSDMNNHLPVSEPFVSRPVFSMFRRRSFGSKNDHVNNSKHWTSNRLYPDSGTATVSCHNRSVVTPAKSVDPRHPSTCNVDKNSNSNSYISKAEPSDSGISESSECLSPCNKEVFRLKTNYSPSLTTNHGSAVHGGSNVCLDSTSETAHLNTLLQTSMQYPVLGDNSSADPEPADRSSFESDVADKSVVSGLPNCNSHSENLYSSHCKGQENSTFSKQTAVSPVEARLSPTSFGSSNRCSPSLSATHASYADIIRAPTATHKISVSPVFHSANSSVTRTAEISSAAALQDALQKEVEQASSSSEWIISRLSQVHANVSMNGGSLHHQVTLDNNNSMHARPIAVSLEKPSFYNSSLGIAKTLNACVQQSSLSSPEKRMLECQYVEEHLCSMLSNKKPGEKISFLSELPTSLPSPGEQSNSMACTNSRTDSVFSDSSSVCSSTSSNFKAEVQRQVAEIKGNAPPVIIMNNCMPMSNVSDISFGIEMDEIMQICSTSSKTLSDTCSSALSDTVLSKNFVNISSSEKEVPCDAGCTGEAASGALNFITVAGKKLLWKGGDVDVSRCNLGHIMDFLQESWHHIELAVNNVNAGECTDVVRYYSDE